MNKKTLLLILLLALTVAPSAFATTGGGGGGLPWEGPLTTFRDSITGPVAMTIAVLAIAVAGAMLIFGGEINNFARMCCYIILVAGLLVSANNIMTTLYGAGAVVPAGLIPLPSIPLVPSA